MKKILHFLDNIEKYLLFVLLLVMTLVCFIQVVCRYLLHLPLIWADEFLRGCFAWASFLGVSQAFKERAHLGVDFFTAFFPPKMKKIVFLLTYVVSLVFMAALTVYGWRFVMTQIMAHRMTISLGVPMCVITFAVPISSALASIRILQVILSDYFFKNKIDAVSNHNGGPEE